MFFQVLKSSIKVEGAQTRQSIKQQLANAASRLAIFAHATASSRTASDAQFVRDRINELAGDLDAGAISASESLLGLQELKGTSWLDTEVGRRLINSLKNSAIIQLSDINDFEVLGGVLDAFPDIFVQSELEEIRDAYSEYAEEYASDCSRGNFHIDNPDLIRDEAYRLGAIDEALGVSTKPSQDIIEEYAGTKEKDSEQEQNWDEEDRGTRGDRGDHCSDQELDSMFRTLAE